MSQVIPRPRRSLLERRSCSGPAQTQKPPLHAKHWIAITGKPLAATAGAMMFARGGNAVDAACAMLGAVTTMWDVLSLGRRDPGAHLQPEAQEGHRHQRPRRGPDAARPPTSTAARATATRRSTGRSRR